MGGEKGGGKKNGRVEGGKKRQGVVLFKPQ